MLKFTFRVEGASEFERAWHRFGDEIMQSAGAIALNAAAAGLRAGNAMLRGGTGSLRGSGAVNRRSRSRDYVEAEIRWSKDYASYVDQGTKPHVIRPREGHGFIGALKEGQKRRTPKDIGTYRIALRFQDADGTTIFRRLVNHKGIQRPVKFSDEAMQVAVEVISVELGAAIERASAHLNRDSAGT